jgi:Cu/Ag efflux pump CusA
VQLERIKQKLPKDIKIAKWYDQSDLIVASALSVREALLIGLGLAIVTLLVFLRNIKVTLIAAITVPMALSATVLIIYLLGLSFNIMTLGGMAAAVALIIDDAIVMIEHIIRRMREASGTYLERIHLAVNEFTKPLVGSSASTIIIFAPLAFLSGVSGSFFKALSITMASALFISFIVNNTSVLLQTTGGKDEPNVNNTSVLLQTTRGKDHVLFTFGSSLPPVVCRRAHVLFTFGSSLPPVVCRRAHVLFTFGSSLPPVVWSIKLCLKPRLIIAKTSPLILMPVKSLPIKLIY